MNPGAGDPTSAPKNCWLDGPIFRHDVRSPNLIVKVSPHVILTTIHGTKLYFLARTHTSSGSGPGIGSTKRIQKRFRLDGALPVAMNVLFATWRTCLEKALAVIDIRLKQAILHKRRPKILKLHSSNDLSSYMHTGNIKKATEDNPSKNHNQINKPNQTFNNQIQEPNIDPKNGTIQSAILRHRNITTCHLSNVTIKFTREERAETVPYCAVTWVEEDWYITHVWRRLTFLHRHHTHCPELTIPREE